MKPKKTICLNMIVKNESHVIKRCLDSVKGIIDTWIIVDTGSTDGTQDIIKEHLKEIPGELHEQPWVDFAHNRNEALQLAEGKSDYLLLIDADDRLVFSKNFALPKLEADCYSIAQREGTSSTFREHQIFFLIRNDRDFEWEGVLHEYLRSKTQKEISIIPLTGVFNEYINDGHRSKNTNVIQEDIYVLKKAIKDNPNNSRYVLYLARTYASMGDFLSAIPYFKKRAEMGGDPMEVYHALLCIGIGQLQLKEPPEIFLRSFCRAYLYRPSRTEALYEVARYFANAGNYFLGYLVSKLLITISPSKDPLFVETWVDDWGSLLYFFLCSLEIGEKEEAHNALIKLLKNPRLPSKIKTEFKLEEAEACCKT